MSTDNRTTVPLQKETQRRLRLLKTAGESYDDLLNRMMANYEPPPPEGVGDVVSAGSGALVTETQLDTRLAEIEEQVEETVQSEVRAALTAVASDAENEPDTEPFQNSDEELQDILGGLND
jgi:hypothetical protein